MSAAEILVPLALGVIVNEAIDVCPWLGRKLVRWSARRITDPSMAERYEEEWLAGLESRPGKLLQLLSAVSIVMGASWRMRDIFRAADTEGASRRRRRWPRRHMRLAFPGGVRGLGSYWGYVASVLAAIEWITGQGSWTLALTLTTVSVLYFAFQVPTYCAASTRSGEVCRNSSRGLLLGCHIRQHRWIWLRELRRSVR
ncbi:MAG: hypothetical protein WCD21_25360 [Streptomyces sp.]